MIFNLGELFSGPGGLALGAALAKDVSAGSEKYSIRHIWGVDKDNAAIDTYRENISRRFGGAGLCIDAMKFCRNEIDKLTPINALAFGFPCNDFSLVGKKRGLQGQYGSLYKAGVLAINKMNPYWFIAENVSGIHYSDSGTAFKKILSELKKAGKYGYLLTVHLYKFEEYGIPQYRHRYIIVGTRKDLDVAFRVPASTHGDKSRCSYISAEKALSNIPSDSFNHDSAKQNSRVIMRLKYIPPWNNAWFLDDLLDLSPKSRRMILQRLPWYNSEIAHLSDYRIKREITYSKLNCKKARMSHIYKRLDAAQPAYTITGSGGGGTHVYHWREHRALTNRERARLQGFPDWFEFKGSRCDVRKQIGMAVPPHASKKIFEAILKAFAGISYKSADPNYSI
jgi:DNA (cytosine-5)-methyltransferase 1